MQRKISIVALLFGVGSYRIGLPPFCQIFMYIRTQETPRRQWSIQESLLGYFCVAATRKYDRENTQKQRSREMRYFRISGHVTRAWSHWDMSLELSNTHDTLSRHRRLDSICPVPVSGTCVMHIWHWHRIRHRTRFRRRLEHCTVQARNWHAHYWNGDLSLVIVYFCR